MKWLEYKHKWATGADKEPTYVEIPDDYFDAEGNFNEDFIEDYELLDRHGIYSDRYRGIDYDIVDNPPRKVVIGLIASSRARIENAKRSLEKYSALLETMDSATR